MSKLYVFAIGGTGVRVLKSLALLLGSGVKINASEVIPIIIDVDKGGGDLVRTIEILNTYKAIHTSVEQTTSSSEYKGFFKTKIKDLFERSGTEFRFDLSGIQNAEFREYIDYNSLPDSDKHMASMLFSESNLKLRMDVGFKGNPNLGSVVLNQFESSPDYIKFATDFNTNDRIFIISSIHGGTGASGFPLLIKNLRDASNTKLPNNQDITAATIGALTVLPYFKLKQGEIQSQDFISKTIAALDYYTGNLIDSINALYYIGLNEGNTYENKPGGENQKNSAHFVELASALAIVDFTFKDKKQIPINAQNKFFEFGVKGSLTNKLTFNSLSEETNEIIKLPLIKLWYLNLYAKNRFIKTLNKQPWSNRGPKETQLVEPFDSSKFYRDIESFLGFYTEWLQELADNKPGFSPFTNNAESDSRLSCISDMEPKTRSFRWKEDYTKFDDILNREERKASSINKSAERKYIEIFNQATEKVFRHKY